MKECTTFKISRINNHPQHNNPEDLNPHDTCDYMHFTGEHSDLKTETSRFSCKSKWAQSHISAKNHNYHVQKSVCSILWQICL